MKIGFVGNGSDKFTSVGERTARAIIREFLVGNDVEAMVSGHSPVGGIDIWAEEEANKLGIPLDLKIPQIQQWNPPGGYGYKARNLDIARDSDELHVIVARDYPSGYTGRRFTFCYHCKNSDHVKSGGCWTGKQAQKLGTNVYWWFIDN